MATKCSLEQPLQLNTLYDPPCTHHISTAFFDNSKSVIYLSLVQLESTAAFSTSTIDVRRPTETTHKYRRYRNISIETRQPCLPYVMLER